MPATRRLSAALLPVIAGIAVLVATQWPPSLPSHSRPARPDPPLASAEPADGPLHPVVPVPVRPLPRLEESDPATRSALEKVPGGAALVERLVPNALLRRFVASVDFAPGPHLPARLYPLVRPGGEPVVADEGGDTTLSPDNALRYEPYVALLERLDVAGMFAVYARFYPLLQQTYRAVARRGDHFNDRLVAALDDLLAAPAPQAPVRLLRDGPLYRYADPYLEARSGGQKLMMRIGANNAARVKAKLREYRRLLAMRPPAR